MIQRLKISKFSFSLPTRKKIRGGLLVKFQKLLIWRLIASPIIQFEVLKNLKIFLSFQGKGELISPLKEERMQIENFPKTFRIASSIFPIRNFCHRKISKLFFFFSNEERNSKWLPYWSPKNIQFELNIIKNYEKFSTHSF